MPVSKKRKKGGKPVQRKVPVTAGPAESTDHGPESKPAVHEQRMAGKPSNPFVSQQQAKRGAQRGR